MVVNVRFFGLLAAMAGERRVTLSLPEGSTLGDVVAELGKRFGQNFLDSIVRAPGEMHSYCQAFVNDTQVDDLAAGLEAGGPAAEVGLILLMASEGG